MERLANRIIVETGHHSMVGYHNLSFHQVRIPSEYTVVYVNGARLSVFKKWDRHGLKDDFVASYPRQIAGNVTIPEVVTGDIVHPPFILITAEKVYFDLDHNSDLCSPAVGLRRVNDLLRMLESRFGHQNPLTIPGLSDAQLGLKLGQEIQPNEFVLTH